MKEDFASTVHGVTAAIQSVIEGKADVVRLVPTGGTLTVHSRRGQGTRLVAKLPGRLGEPVSHLPGDPGKGG